MNIIKKNFNWRVIEWRIPTTIEGLNSMEIAINRGFKNIGYDVGSIIDKNGVLNDSVVMYYYPKNILNQQFENVNLTKTNTLLFNKVKKTFINK